MSLSSQYSFVYWIVSVSVNRCWFHIHFCYRQSSLEYVLILNENTDSSLQKLKEDIRTLEIFKEQNRDYLDKLFEKDVKEFIEETELNVKIM